MELTPPRFPLRVLRTVCHPDLIEDMEGDLVEIYARRIRSGSRSRARFLFWFDVLRSIRPYALRRSIPLPTGPVMFKNYISVSFRHISRHLGFSLINVTGLAVGLAVALLTVLYVTHEQSYDRFHENADRIARISMTWIFGETRMELALSTTAPGPASKAQIPEVDEYVRFRRMGETFVQRDDEWLKETGVVFADSALFSMFTFPLIEGNSVSALAGPGRVTLSESMANRYFGRTDIVGETVLMNGSELYEVTGVFQDIPTNSHIQFDMAASFASLPEAGKVAFDNSQYHTYVLLAPGATFAKLQSDLDAAMNAMFGGDPSTPLLHVTPFTDVYLHSQQSAEWSPGGDIRYVYLFSAIAALILLIACINYMNLATARSVHRAREVGMRKVLGARQGQIFGQFLGEALIMTALSIVVAWVLVVLALPLYNGLTGQEQTWHALLRPGTLGVGWLVISLLAGAYPAMVLAHILPLRILKGAFRHSQGGVFLRRSLVVFQFAISFILIAGTITINRQLGYVQHKELGYDREHVVVVPVHSDALDRVSTLKTAVARLGGVTNVSASSSAPSGGAGARTYRPDEDPESRQLLDTIQIDEAWLDMMDIPLLAGRGPTDEETSRSGEASRAIVLNREAVGLFGWTVDEAVGKTMYSAGVGANVEVVGVTDNFHYRSLHETIGPLVLVASTQARYLLVRTAPGRTPETVEALKDTWASVVPDRPFDYVFQDARFDAQYREEERMGTLFSVFSGLAILIACLGLLGLAAFTVVQKTKEIGIRKVLGATSMGLASLVVREFVVLVGVAMILATPVAWIGLDRWLQDFAYHVDVTWWTFVLAGGLALTIALVTVSYQSLRAASQDPVISLRSDP